MRRFWDRRARENPWYFINNTLDYRSPDLERFWASGERDLDALLDTVGATLDPGDRVVEIGCGAGRMTRAIAARVADVRAVDVAPAMLRIAEGENGNLDNVEWLLGDGESLDGIPDASADACVSHVVLQHIPDPQVTLGYVREMGRVLRPGGWAAFQVSNAPEIHTARPTGPLRAWDVIRGRAPKGQADPAWLGSAVEIDELRDAAADGGLELERVEGEGTQFCMVLARRRA